MNTIEKKKWKNFSIFSIIVIVIICIIFLFLNGISIEAAKSTVKYSAILIAIGFFWIFCVRDTNG